jgi:hypothetical protein
MRVCFTSQDFGSLGSKFTGIEDLTLTLSALTQNLIAAGLPITFGGTNTQIFYDTNSYSACPSTTTGECVYLDILVWSMFTGKTDLQVTGNAYLDLEGDTGNNRRSVKVNMDRLLQTWSHYR